MGAFPPHLQWLHFISTCLVLLFLFMGVSFSSVLLDFPTKFRPEAAAELLAVGIQFTNGPVALKSHVAEFQFWHFARSFSRVQDRQCNEQLAIYRKKVGSDPEKFLLNIKMKWAWTKFLNSCFQSLMLLGVDIPKLTWTEQESIVTAWAKLLTCLAQLAFLNMLLLGHAEKKNP